MSFLPALLLLLVFFFPPGTASAAPASNEVCLSCHGAPGLQKARQGKSVSLQVEARKFSRSVHAPLGCAVCHSAMSQIPHPAEARPAPCATCHEGASRAYEQSIHGKARARGFTEAASCAGCHGNVHELVRRGETASPIHTANIAKTCAACHADAALAEKFRIPVVRPVEAYLKSVHARAVAAGKPGAACSDCHGSHSIMPGQDPRSSISQARIPATCGKCHSEVLKAFERSIHGEAMARGVRGAPVCTDCHGEHRILARTEPTSPVFAANIPGETCGRCHADTRLTEKYGLGLDKVPAFQDSYHGLALRTGQLTVANCSSCHGVHDIRPSGDPRSHVHKDNLAATCGKCHPGAGTRFALGPVHVVPTADGAWMVYWIRLIYLWLIGLTVGFMLLHNFLDLWRKARRAGPHVAASTAPAQERMPRSIRWQHGLVMATFPLLVYTGFALTYPEEWWAAPLLRWETRLGLRGLIHRIAACVLTGSLLWHVAHLAVSRELRRRLGGLMFRLKDVGDFIRLQRYNLGFGQDHPRFGKFSYIEKAEYWAFLWGMGVMTATGLLLWFENLSLTYLPKWVTDAATAVHFYEAILATLSILVWHFYWVIFDPDVYPMDASWWHGRPPAARAEERGEEEEAGAPSKADSEEEDG
ncbi:MAG: cytochrome c3 family protein [Deltaproteobacteria bacterium]|nr:cytochrome c3 family protein [Deltaproteobacteria bacterium]